MLGLLALFLALAAIFGSLGAWQLSRAYERGAASHDKKVAAELRTDDAQGPQGLGNVLPPQSSFTNEMVGESVWVKGTYDASGQVLVPERKLGDRIGYLVVTPLRVTDDGTGGKSWASLPGAPVVPVVRGWIAAPGDAPAPPTGPVRVEGWLEASEATNDASLPDGQIDSVSSAVLANRWGGPIYGGYVDLTSSDPAQVGDLTPVPRPDNAGGSSKINLQSLSYAFQWWLFACFAFFVWWRVVRDQRDHENAALADAAADGDGVSDGRPPVLKRGEDGIAGLPAKR
jgi:cytochrome oxidase assembly protein ShyY1